MGLDNTVRLYVGGLPHDVTSEQLAQRFRPFGSVGVVQLVPDKSGTVPTGSLLKPCRGFAYVQLMPKDEAALRRCLSMYNACKWLGGVLRVEPAQPDYRARWAHEEAAEQAQQQEADEAGMQQQQQLPAGAVDAGEGTAAVQPLYIIRRDGKKTLKVEPNRVKSYFPAVRQRSAAELDWAPPAQSPGVARIATLQALQGSSTQLRAAPVAAAPAAPAAAEASGAAERAGKLQGTRQEEQEGTAGAAQLPDEEEINMSEPELEAVDFMSEDEHAAAHAASAADDHRFDSSSSEGGSDAEEEQDALAGVDSAEREQVSDLAAAEQLHSTAASETPTLEGRQQGGQDEDIPDSSEESESHEHGASEQDVRQPAEEQAAADPPAEVRDGMAESTSASDAAGSSADESSRSDEQIAPGSEQQDEASSGGEQAGRRDAAEEAPQHEAEGVYPEEPSTPASPGHAPQRAQAAESKEAQLLRGLAEALPRGAAFFTAPGDRRREAAWQAAREGLVADYKSKRRMALRQQQQGSSRRPKQARRH